MDNFKKSSELNAEEKTSTNNIQQASSYNEQDASSNSKITEPTEVDQNRDRSASTYIKPVPSNYLPVAREESQIKDHIAIPEFKTEEDIEEVAQKSVLVFYDNDDTKVYYEPSISTEVIHSENKIAHLSSILETEEQDFRVDFVLVYTKTAYHDPKKYAGLNRYLENLQEIGLKLQVVEHQFQSEIVFVLIHARDDIILHYAELYDVDLAFHNLETIKLKESTQWPECTATDLCYPEENPELFKRGRKILYKNRPKEILSSERILIIQKILQRVSFGESDAEMGLSKIKKNGILSDSYAVHDGDIQWTDEGPLNGRQILCKYWASFKAWNKVQPLDIIERYCGTEQALYFAWLGLYNQMLIYASIVSAFVIFAGGYYGLFTNLSDDYCDSDLPMCTKCDTSVRKCSIVPLHRYCMNATIAGLLDNPVSVGYSLFISCWSAIFIQLWKRKQTTLQYRWNKLSVKLSIEMRPEFISFAKHRRISPITGKLEPYLSLQQQMSSFAVTYVTILFLAAICVAVSLSVTLFKLAIEAFINKHRVGKPPNKYIAYIPMIIGSTIMVIFITIFEKIYDNASIWLTKRENPRTQMEYDNSYIYKKFILSFVNVFSPEFYLAFVKGRLATYPASKSHTAWGFQLDKCVPPSCVVDVSFQIVFVTCFKSTIGNLKAVIVPYIQQKLKQSRATKGLTRWEEDFILLPTRHFYLIGEYMHMLIQFGHIIFFAAAFPPGAILCLLNNIFELRIDAIKMTRLSRRAVPRRVATIGAWEGLMKIVFFIGVVVNACCISFTTKFIDRRMYGKSTNSALKGHALMSLSAFDGNDFPDEVRPDNFTGYCYYEGMRYGPGHPNKYQQTDLYYLVTTVALIFVVVWEVVMLLFSVLLTYMIKETPAYVAEKLRLEQNELKQMRMKSFNHAEEEQIHSELNRPVSQFTM